ncbi:MAG: alpha/beta hydrolase [Roseovarius sp.]
MPLIHVNTGPTSPVLHDGAGDPAQRLPDLLRGNGPVILMVHGYKYAPHHATECPHDHIFSLSPERTCFKVRSWPAGLGFGAGATDEGLGIGFGWPARGNIWRAYAAAAEAGAQLAQLVMMIRTARPDRPIHAVAHSLGARVVLSALPHLPEGAIQRLILLAGAEFGQRAAEALATPAGRGVEVINITSRENDFYDFLLECLIPAPRRGDRSLGLALPDSPKVLTLQMDDPGTLAALNRAGFAIAPPAARICHWSPYTRPGVFALYNSLLRRGPDLPLSALRAALPATFAPRWSRLMTLPELSLPLPMGRKPSF